MCGNYSKVETIQGRKLYEEIRQVEKTITNKRLSRLGIRKIASALTFDYAGYGIGKVRIFSRQLIRDFATNHGSAVKLSKCRPGGKYKWGHPGMEVDLFTKSKQG